MILIDYSGITMPIVFTMSKGTIELEKMRHMILNTLRMYNVKYRRDYGQMILCLDGGSWRKRVLKEYKASRKSGREESSIDWDKVWEILNVVRDELIEYMPYPVVAVKDAEADDVIATLVKSTQSFGQHERVMIVSSDKDFIQLQKYGNVSQYSPITRKMLKDPNPVNYCFEHVLRGCGGDGVPNVLSDDNTFITEGKRQTPLRKKLIEEWKQAGKENLKDVMDEKTYRNYCRNLICIDFDHIPEEIQDQIMSEYRHASEIASKNEAKVLNYLISNKMKMLVGSCSEFFTTP